MAIQKNPEWHAWATGLIYWAKTPPCIYFIVIGLLIIAIIYSNTPKQSIPLQTRIVTVPQYIPQTVPRSPSQPSDEQEAERLNFLARKYLDQHPDASGQPLVCPPGMKPAGKLGCIAPIDETKAVYDQPCPPNTYRAADGGCPRLR